MFNEKNSYFYNLLYFKIIYENLCFPGGHCRDPRQPALSRPALSIKDGPGPGAPTLFQIGGSTLYPGRETARMG